MLLKEIRKALEHAFIHDGELCDDLYKYELEEHVGYWRRSMIRDHDDFLFVATVRTDDVDHEYNTALLLIERSGEAYINEPARDRLKELWGKVYFLNMKKLIPTFAQQLKQGELPVTGVKMVETFMA